MNTTKNTKEQCARLCELTAETIHWQDYPKVRVYGIARLYLGKWIDVPNPDKARHDQLLKMAEIIRSQP